MIVRFDPPIPVRVERRLVGYSDGYMEGEPDRSGSVSTLIYAAEYAGGSIPVAHYVAGSFGLHRLTTGVTVKRL